MGFIENILQMELFQSLLTALDGYLQDGFTFLMDQDLIIKVAMIFGGAIIIFLGTLDLVKRLSKLIFIAFVLFALYFVYTNYLA